MVCVCTGCIEGKQILVKQHPEQRRQALGYFIERIAWSSRFLALQECGEQRLRVQIETCQGPFGRAVLYGC